MADRLLYRGEQVVDPSQINRSIGQIAQSIPLFLAQESPFICANGALNYVGALLMLRHLPYYQEQIEHSPHQPKLEIRIPAVTETHEVIHEGVTVGSANILHKRSHGLGDKEYGLVLDGDLTGSFVWFAGDKAYPERLFNDEPIPPDQKKYRPYTPIFVEDEDDSVMELIADLERIYKEQYYALVDEARISLSKPHLRISDLLFYLCDKLRIPIDRSRFHATRARQ